MPPTGFNCSLASLLVASLVPAYALAGGRAPSRAASSRFAAVQLPFVANAGQVDDQVAYYAEVLNGTMFVTTDGELIYALQAAATQRQRSISTAERLSPRRCWVLKETAVHGMPRPVEGEPVGARVNFFVGKDPTHWRRGVAAYRSVQLGEVWPGVSVELRAHGAGVERVFTLASGVSPKAIRMRFEGARKLWRNRDGSLHVETGLGQVSWSAPVAYQQRGETRVPVTVAYRLIGAFDYGFELGDHDLSLPVVIDPFLQSTYAGGGGVDFGLALAVQPSGEIYLAGWTASTSFPGTTGGAQTTYGGAGDGFVARFDRTLTSLLQATYVGGSDYEFAGALAVNPSSGEVYLGGYTESADFPGTAGGAQSAYGGVRDGFVARFDSGLTQLLQATYVGGSGHEAGVGSPQQLAMGLDSLSGDVYLAGHTDSVDLPGTAGGAQPVNGGGTDGFVVRLGSTLTSLRQATYLGGSGSEGGFALAVHPTSGDVYLAGSTSSRDLPGRVGGAQSTFREGGSDGYIARFNPPLTSLLQSTYAGGSGHDTAHALAIHPQSGEAYLGGVTLSTDLSGTAGGAQLTSGGRIDGFVARFQPALTALLQATYLGGVADDHIEAIAVHPVTGEIYVTGYLSSVNGSTGFPGVTGGAQQNYGGGSRDGSAARLDATLASLLQATYAGGNGADQSEALALHPVSGDVYLGGDTTSTSFPAADGGAQPLHGGGLQDAFLGAVAVHPGGRRVPGLGGPRRLVLVG